MTKKKLIKLRNPITFSEKIQFLKLHERSLDAKLLADKILVKEYIADLIGAKYVIPNIKVFEKPSEIEFYDLLPNTVLKCNHDSGSAILIKDKISVTKYNSIIRKIKKSFNKNPFYFGREFSYHNINKRILLEPLIPDEPYDYKVHIFGGKAKIIQVDIDRFKDHKRNNYDLEWNLLELKIEYSQSKIDIPRPYCLDEMIRLSELISKDKIYLRVDWYIIDNNLKFGEITFYPGSGQETISPYMYEIILGNLVDISSLKSC
jgi:hypothetical protein